MNELIPTKKKAVIYCRVSTKEQVEEGNSLATQERICKEYALTNGCEIVETYLEQGESAKTAHRTELQKLLAYCSMKKNGVKQVIIYKLDRLSRNTDDYSQLRLMLKRYGVEIKSTSEHFENTPVGRFMENTLANISQFDNDIRAERCTGGMKEAIREGRYVWKAPIGYDNVRVCGKATIDQNPTLAPLVRKAFEMIASNICSAEEVYRVMTKEGLNRNGKPLVNSYFREMLVNRLYTGWIEKFGETHTGLFEPIVSGELFAQVQRVLKFKGKLNPPHKTDHPDFPLRRFITNENNTKLTGSWSKGRRQRYPYYRFGRTGTGHNYNRDRFENRFMQYMDSFGFGDQHYEKLSRFIKEELTGRDQIEQKDIEKIKAHIQELTKRQSTLVKKNVDGVISDSILKQQLEVIDLELTNAHASLFRGVSSPVIDLNEGVAYLKEYFKNPSLVWRRSSPQTKLRLQRFQFPLGCTFQNDFFGTAQISIFFKAKSVFEGSNFARVDSGLKTGNNLQATTSLTQQASNSSPAENNLPNFDEDFWREFRKDVSTVYDILNSKEQNNSS